MVRLIVAYAGVIAAVYFGGVVICKLGSRSLSYLTAGPSPGQAKSLLVVSISMLSLVAVLLIAFDTDMRDSLGTIWITAIAAAILAITVPGPVTVTAEGLQRTNSFRRNTLIRWDDLDHYEVRKGSQGVSDVYYFRTRDGKTIKVNDWTQDGHDLLSKINQYKPLSESPTPD